MPGYLWVVLVLSVTPSLAAQLPRSHDSAGVQIIETAPWKVGAKHFTIGTKARYDVGGLLDNPDDEFQPGSPLHAVSLSNGDVAVLDKTRIQYFDAQGKLLRSVGRPGAGPGDFGMLTTACRLNGDTIVAYDSRNRRVAVVSPVGVIVATLPTSGEYAAPGFCFADGSFELHRSVAGTGVQVIRYRTSGVADTMTTVPAPKFDQVFFTEISAVAQGSMLYTGSTVDHVIRVYSEDGVLKAILRSNEPPEPISGSDRKIHADWTIPTKIVGSARAARAEATALESTRPTWPTFAKMMVDPLGRIWLSPYREAIGVQQWIAIDAKGSVVGTLEIPPGTKEARSPLVESFGMNEVTLVRTDADGASHLTVFPLVPPR